MVFLFSHDIFHGLLTDFSHTSLTHLTSFHEGKCPGVMGIHHELPDEFMMPGLLERVRIGRILIQNAKSIAAAIRDDLQQIRQITQGEEPLMVFQPTPVNTQHVPPWSYM